MEKMSIKNTTQEKNILLKGLYFQMKKKKRRIRVLGLYLLK